MVALFVWVGPALAAPATVLEEHVEYAIGYDRRVTTSVDWKVRIDDPAACEAGLVGPDGLAGATSGGATMIENVLALPAGVSAGQVFDLRRVETTAMDSAVFLTAPGLPVEHLTVTVRAPGNLPLSVWADPHGHPTWSSKAGRSVEMAWDGVPEASEAQLVWSSLSDWFEAGDRTTRAVESHLATKSELGREVAGDADSIGISEAVRRVYAIVEVTPGNTGSWYQLRPAGEVARDGSGTGAERGAVLISLLRVAGMDARPAWFRPVAARGAFPVTVPAPAMVAMPAVVVRRAGKEAVWIDPSAPFAAGGAPPAGLVGGIVWEPGDLPRPSGTSERVEGTVAVQSTVTLGDDGGITWSAAITADGTAVELFRTLLRPLDESGQRAALERLIRVGHPDATQVHVDVSGASRVDKPLTIILQGREGKSGTVFEAGMRETVRPVIAPALAAWLPPHLQIREVMAIQTPTTLDVAGAARAEPIARPEALVARILSHEGPRWVSTTEIERPYFTIDPVREGEATRLLADEALRGPTLLLLTPDPAERERVLAKGVEALDPSEEAWFRAFPYFQDGRRKKAEKIVGAALGDRPRAELVDALVAWGPSGDKRPWEALLSLVSAPADRLEVARGMARAGLGYLADGVARAVVDSSADAALRLDAIELALETQVEGVEGWKDPNELLATAEQLGAGEDPRFALPRARAALAEQRYADATAILRPLAGTAPEVDVLLAEAGAGSGQPEDSVVDAALRAVASAPDDSDVQTAASDALALAGQADAALEHALVAARLSGDDPDRWSHVVDRALGAGDLQTAGWAARRASDLDADDGTRGETLLLMARLLGDRGLEDVAWERLGGRANAGDRQGALAAEPPATLDDLIAVTPANALLALLAWRDAEVVADAVKLGIRAQMRLDGGQLDEAARDGMLLAIRHGRPDGWAIAFAATAGRMYSTPMVAALDRAAADDPAARSTRLDYRLISGNGDALVDARALADDRGKAVLTARTAAPDGWPSDLVTPKLPPPRGFRPNAALSVPGVQAFSDPDDAIAVLRIGGAPAVPPPPIGGLYTVAPRPVADLPDGARLVRLLGGFIPAYAAIAQDGALQIVGIGFTREGALRALERGRP
jgi:hypothetical protein